MIKPKDTMIAYKFNEDDIAEWRSKANKAGINLSEWMKLKFDWLASNPIEDERNDDDKKLCRALRPRNTNLSRRFNKSDIDRWVKAAGEESMTSWCERALKMKDRK